MRRLSLNETWTKCLSMWKWIVEQWKKDKTQSVSVLKREWCSRHRIDIQGDCFFCDYDLRIPEGNSTYGNCSHCPGRLVSPSFNCCKRAYDHRNKPDKFYRKLLALNKRRLARRRKSNASKS